MAVGNQKGGVGKTTTSLTLAHIAAASGKRVLMIDMDASGALTRAATGQMSHEVTVANAIGGASPSLALARTIVSVGERIDVAPGGAPLEECEVRLTSRVGREHFLKRTLDNAPGRWDLVIIDTPPTHSLMTTNALVAAHNVLIPAKAQALDLAGLQDFRRTIAEVQELANPRLKIAGVVATFYSQRFVEHRRSAQEITDAGLYLCKTTIGCSVRIAEASRHCRPITEFAVDNPQAVAYRQLAQELNLVGEQQC